MADLFTTVCVAPVDKATTSLSSLMVEQTESSALVRDNQTTDAPQSTKISGSNFSMCEIIM
ncbi:hypothetical protein RSAG8_03983, partial [Rhizoctonia solani AG-8 WAC10335]